MDGYSYAHKKKCVTVFSAPNYCCRCGNQAAVLEVGEDLEYHYQCYEPSPKEKESEPSRRVPEYFLWMIHTTLKYYNRFVYIQ